MKAALALLLLAAGTAHAAPVLEASIGLDVPASDDEYTSHVDPSADLQLRVGARGRVLGGLFSFDWTPLSSNDQNVSYYRLRFLGHLTVHRALAPKIELDARFGAGVDLVHEAFDATLAGFHVSGSDSDIGLALEIGTGVWFAVGRSTQIGVQLAVPISIHGKDGNPNNPNDPNDAKFDFTSIDIDLLGGVRLRL